MSGVLVSIDKSCVAEGRGRVILVFVIKNSEKVFRGAKGAILFRGGLSYHISKGN